VALEPLAATLTGQRFIGHLQFKLISL